MKETDFLTKANEFFNGIQDRLDLYDWDFDYDFNGDVFVIQESGKDIILLNKNIVKQELWLSYSNEAYHFSYHEGNWFSTKNRYLSIYMVLNEILNSITGEDFNIETDR